MHFKPRDTRPKWDCRAKTASQMSRRQLYHVELGWCECGGATAAAAAAVDDSGGGSGGRENLRSNNKRSPDVGTNSYDH